METLDKSNLMCIFVSSKSTYNVLHEQSIHGKKGNGTGDRRKRCMLSLDIPYLPAFFSIMSKSTEARREELSGIMRTAWTVAKSENISLSTALRLAWKSFKLKLRMKTEVVKFAFKKIDGTVREAVGTLVSSMLPKRDESQPTKERAKNYGVQVYYDLDRDCFRSFKVANLLLN